MGNKTIVEIIVRGGEGNKVTALQGLLSNMEYNEVKEAAKGLDINTLIKLLQCLHGVLYQIVKGRNYIRR